MDDRFELLPLVMQLWLLEKIEEELRANYDWPIPVEPTSPEDMSVQYEYAEPVVELSPLRNASDGVIIFESPKY